jgi:hypothetical protein
MIEPAAGPNAAQAHATDSPTVVPAVGQYRYEVQIGWHRSRIRHWRGRVVSYDPSGKPHHWQYRSARTRDALIGQLWQEATRDIRWRTGRASIEIVERD